MSNLGCRVCIVDKWAFCLLKSLCSDPLSQGRKQGSECDVSSDVSRKEWPSPASAFLRGIPPEPLRTWVLSLEASSWTAYNLLSFYSGVLAARHLVPSRGEAPLQTALSFPGLPWQEERRAWVLTISSSKEVGAKGQGQEGRRPAEQPLETSTRMLLLERILLLK